MIPTLDSLYVARRIYSAIMYEEKEVFIKWYIFYLKIAVELLPLKLKNYAIRKLVGEGMHTFVGRNNSKKTN